MKFLRYNTDTRIYQQAAKVTLDRLTNGVTVKNNGNTVCLFNSDPLLPGESKAVGGNYGEIYTGRLDISFNVIGLTPAPVTPVNSAVVTYKFYQPGDGFDNP